MYIKTLEKGAMGEETGDPLEVPVCQSIIVPVAKGLVINKKTAKAVAPAEEMSCPLVNNKGAKRVIPNWLWYTVWLEDEDNQTVAAIPSLPMILQFCDPLELQENGPGLFCSS